jgi:cystathionine beta-lyase
MTLLNMTYNFDKIIDRQNTNALSVEGFRGYLFGDYQNLEFPFPDEDLIKMWVADMEFETAPEIINGIRKRLDHGVFGYTLSSEESYSNAIVDWIEKRHKYQYNHEHIVSSKGVIPALFYLIKRLCNQGKKALIMTPSYAYFKHAADANNIELEYTKLLNDNGKVYMDFEDIKAKVSDKEMTTLIFCNPHNPTGRLWTADELKKLGDICFQNEVTIISDEIHCDLVREGALFTPFQKVFPDSDQIVTCISASKTFNLAGMFLSATIIPNDELRDQWLSDHLQIQNPLSIAAYRAAYTSGGPWLESLTKYIDSNFEEVDNFIKKRLPKAKFNIPESTYLAWINVEAYFENSDVEDLTLFFAQKAGILLEGGNMFVDNADGFIRLNLACPKIRVLEGMERIASVLTEDAI